MSITMRVSLPGYDALTETNIYNYSLYADSDNVLIKEHSRGSGNGNATITHSLGYVPFFLVYVDIGSGVFRIVNAQSPFDSGAKVYATSTTLEITNNTGNDYQYYIFYDNMA